MTANATMALDIGEPPATLGGVTDTVQRVPPTRRATSSPAGSRKEHTPMNPLARLIHSRKEELGLSWYEIADRGGFSSHSIVYALAKKAEHRAPPRLETLQRLAKALDLPLDNVKNAAIEASGLEVKEIEVGLKDADRIRVLVAAVGDMDDRDKDKLIALAEAFAAEAREHRAKRKRG